MQMVTAFENTIWDCWKLQSQGHATAFIKSQCPFTCLEDSVALERTLLLPT